MQTDLNNAFLLSGLGNRTGRFAFRPIAQGITAIARFAAIHPMAISMAAPVRLRRSLTAETIRFTGMAP